MDRVNKPPTVAREPQVSAATILLLAAACGLLAANIYYAQPLIKPIAESLGLAPQASGLIVTMTQIGYGLGLFFVVPLADLVENRRLVLVCVALCAGALAAAALATSWPAFLACAGAIGLGSVAVQILIPLSAHLAPDATRGRVVGAVASGLMIGVMGARPVGSFIASVASWRTVFAASAVVMVVLGLVLSRKLPVRAPHIRMSYGALIVSMARLAAATPILRLRAFYQSCLFGAFSLFWTTTPLLLAGPDYRMTQRGIALFALAGVSGAIAAPIAGRLADRGFARPATGARDRPRRGGLPRDNVGPAGLAACARRARRRGDRRRLRRPRQFCARASLDFLARARRSRPVERRLSRDLLRRRRFGLGGRRMGLREGRLAARKPHWSCAPADRARTLRLSRDVSTRLRRLILARLILAIPAPHERAQSPRRDGGQCESLCLTKC